MSDLSEQTRSRIAAIFGNADPSFVSTYASSAGKAATEAIDAALRCDFHGALTGFRQLTGAIDGAIEQTEATGPEELFEATFDAAEEAYDVVLEALVTALTMGCDCGKNPPERE
ncbi:MAG: hypothetical protein Q8R28_01850 [Dehalococcoidia bacterium]|nr:hypothetical protein [Dehalococcoidia bacterium]